MKKTPLVKNFTIRLNCTKFILNIYKFEINQKTSNLLVKLKGKHKTR